MWDDLMKHLPDFESAVLTAVDDEGYPFSVRCWPYPEAVVEVLRVQLPADMPIEPGPASLLCHKHDENLWNLQSFLVRGVLNRDERGWCFEPRRFVPGAGIGGLPATLRFFINSRRNATRYLEKRGLARPVSPGMRSTPSKSRPLHLRKSAGKPRGSGDELEEGSGRNDHGPKPRAWWAQGCTTAASSSTIPPVSRSPAVIRLPRRSRRRVPRPA